MLFSIAGSNAAPRIIICRSCALLSGLPPSCLPSVLGLCRPAPPASAPPPAKNGSKSQTARLPSRSNLHRAPLLPAVSFLGGFQTPAGPKKTCAIHPAAI